MAWIYAAFRFTGLLPMIQLRGWLDWEMGYTDRLYIAYPGGTAALFVTTKPFRPGDRLYHRYAVSHGLRSGLKVVPFDSLPSRFVVPFRPSLITQVTDRLTVTGNKPPITIDLSPTLLAEEDRVRLRIRRSSLGNPRISSHPATRASSKVVIDTDDGFLQALFTAQGRSVVALRLAHATALYLPLNRYETAALSELGIYLRSARGIPPDEQETATDPQTNH